VRLGPPRAAGDAGLSATRGARAAGETADDGEVLFVSLSAIELDGYRALESGQRVTLVFNGGIQDDGRHRADSVRPEGP